MRVMIRFDRLGECLVVSRGPTFWYQVAASVSGAALGTLALLFTQGSPGTYRVLCLAPWSRS